MLLDVIEYQSKLISIPINIGKILLSISGNTYANTGNFYESQLIKPVYIHFFRFNDNKNFWLDSQQIKFLNNQINIISGTTHIQVDSFNAITKVYFIPVTSVIDDTILSDYLLNNYPAILAYSTSLQLSSNAIKAFRVLRSSDSLETDIGFISGVVNEQSLTDFVGNSNGYITKLYNQGFGGSAYDLAQNNISYAPIIVKDSLPVKINNKLALNFERSSGITRAIGGILPDMNNNDLTTLLVCNSSIADSNINYSLGDNTINGLGLRTNITIKSGNGNTVIFDKNLLNQSCLFLNKPINGSLQDIDIYVNSQLANVTSIGGDVVTPINIPNLSNQSFSATATLNNSFYLQTYCLWQTDQLSNREVIESIINHHYNIY